jgi:hypothetical protein
LDTGDLRRGEAHAQEGSVAIIPVLIEARRPGWSSPFRGNCHGAN